MQTMKVPSFQPFQLTMDLQGGGVGMWVEIEIADGGDGSAGAWDSTVDLWLTTQGLDYSTRKGYCAIQNLSSAKKQNGSSKDSVMRVYWDLTVCTIERDF